MIVRTYGRRSSSNSRSSNSLTFDDADGFDDNLSQESPQELDENTNGDIFSFSFPSQESIKDPWSFDSDPYSFDSSQDSRNLALLPPRSKKPRTELKKDNKKGKKAKKPVAVTETTTLMETQEFGEMMEHEDEVNFALDGLRRWQPVRIRRASLLSLLMVSGTLQQRRLLRTHGTAKTIIDAVLGLNFDDTPSNLAAAALFFVLTSDGQDDYLLDSPSVIRFLLKLLKPVTINVTKDKVSTIGSKLVALSKDASNLNDSKGEESTSASILQKVHEVLISCKELKPRSSRSESETKRAELNPKWIALLTMEKACLSTISLEETTGTVRKTGGNFKEKLREYGGLDAVIDVIRECHAVMEGWLERYSSPTQDSENIVKLESPMLLLKCLKIMENATFLSNDNQAHLLGVEDDFGYRHASQSFTKLILSVIKILSGVFLFKRSSFKPDSKSCTNLSNGSDHMSDLPSPVDDKDDCNEIIYISSSIENCSMDRNPSKKTQKTRISSQNQMGSSKPGAISGKSKSWNSKSSSSTSKNERDSLIKLGKKQQSKKSVTFEVEDSEDPFGSEFDDPFAFGEDENEPSKWDLLSGKKTKNPPQSKKSSSVVEEEEEDDYNDDDEYGSQALMVPSQQESSNVERNDSCLVADNNDDDDDDDYDEKYSLLADCLLTAVKVLMNLTNDNSVGCRQIASCGGLETLCALIAAHFPSFSSYLPVFSDIREKSLLLEIDPPDNKRLSDQELDFLVAILGLLVNLVEKDGHNRSRLAAASISIPSLDSEITDVIPLLCSIFLANQGAGEAAEEGRQLALNEEDPVLEGEKEAEKMIVEAYSALLLAFLSTESKSIRNAIAECLPNRKLSVLVPVLERFVEFHMSLNMISEETHSTVLEVIESLRMA